MNRTLLLVSAVGVLTLAALFIGNPTPSLTTPTPVIPAVATGPDTSHTIARPEDPPATETLPLVTATPAGPVTLVGKLSGTYVRTGPSEAFAWMELKAHTPETTRRVPVSLALVIDRSGSMNGEKLANARRAAVELVNRLTPEDRLALVHYGTDVTSLPSRPVTPEVREDLLKVINAIRDDGSTNIGGALTEAAAMLRPFTSSYRVSRAILLSDGQPTAGLVSTEELKRLTASLREQGITVSALGVGNDFNEELMRGMAEQGGGFSGFINDPSRLAEVFSRELDQAAGTVARRVEVSLALPGAVKGVDVLGLPFTREGNTVKVPLYDLSAGQTARLVVKLTLDTQAATGPVDVLGATVRYVDVEQSVSREAGLALAAQVTDSESLVRAHLDRDVRVHAVRALGAQQMLAAANAMKSGNRTEAFQLLGNVRKLFGTSASALSGELAELDQTEAAYQGASSDADVRRETMHLYKKSMKNFGQNNTY